MTRKTSSWLTKLISTSIWVNSGWRSRRRASSRKHFTIWKYFSKPATMYSCLNSCGLSASAKNLPALVREGTRKLRAPPGVYLTITGVSSSRKPLSSKYRRTTWFMRWRTRRVRWNGARRRSR